MKSFPILNQLGTDFYDVVKPASFPHPQLRWFNTASAQELGLIPQSPSEIQDHFCSFLPFKGNIREPLALRYHGHQFRHYNPDLGDGRGFLLAQFRVHKNIYDLTTKGSGTTPYSRAGDGRLTLKGAIREILATEMLESLGVNTSQTLCVFETGENLERQDEPSPTRGAVLTRRMHSSIRFGTFQRLAYLNQLEQMQKLVDYSLQYYFPHLPIRSDQKISQFFREIVRQTADMAAQLMTSGFVHAVLNTDNMNITGEVFDFGPYRFLPSYNPYFTAAYFDHSGLYSYGRQPEALLWGLEQLGLSLQKIEPHLHIQTFLNDYSQEFYLQHKKHFFRRLNLRPLADAQDDQLIHLFYTMLSEGPKSFEKTYFDFYGGWARQGWNLKRKDLYQNTTAQDFIQLLKKYSVSDAPQLLHPYFLDLDPVTLLIQDIEELWQPIALNDDWSLFKQKLQIIQSFRGVYK